MGTRSKTTLSKRVCRVRMKQSIQTLNSNTHLNNYTLGNLKLPAQVECTLVITQAIITGFHAMSEIVTAIGTAPN